MKILYPEYCYIDVAFGGAKNRNHVMHMNDITIPTKASNCYSSMFRFRKEYKDLVDESGSVRGANQFPCWADYLWFDIDADKIEIAWNDTRKLLILLRSMDLLKDTVIFYSGSKGFHIGVASTAFNLEPSVNLPDMMKEIAQALADTAKIEIDRKIYNHNRLWRIPGTLHRKTGKRKIPLSIKDFNL